MGKFGEKFMNMLRLGDDDDYEYDDYDEEYDDEEDDYEEQPRKVSRFEEAKMKEQEASEVKPAKRFGGRSKVVPMRNQKGGPMEVCVIKPATVEDAKEISDTLNMGTPVVLNLEGIHVDVAQRIIDFISGSCYSIDGNLQKISSYIFIVTPPSVDISGDFQDILGGSFDVAAFKNNN